MRLDGYVYGCGGNTQPLTMAAVSMAIISSSLVGMAQTDRDLFGCPLTTMLGRNGSALRKISAARRFSGHPRGEADCSALDDSGGIMAIISSSLVGMTRTRTLASAAETSISWPRTLFFSSSNFTPMKASFLVMFTRFSARPFSPTPGR